MKEIKKSQKKVANAVSTFTKALDEVMKANDILAEGIKVDEKSYEMICLEIKKLEAKLDDTAWGIMQKEVEIKNNMKLVSKLQDFVGGNE